MPTIAIIGAGPGLGLEIARVFGHQGFSVALLARNKPKLDSLASALGQEGIKAAGFAADVTDPDSMGSAFTAIRDRFGAIDVLEFSPSSGAGSPELAPVDVLEVTRENIQPQLDFYLYGGIAAAEQVLPAMIEAGAGTLIFTTGGGSVTPIPMLGNVNVASAALRNWVINLHGALAPKGIYAVHVAISAWIGSGKPEAEASAIAQEYWKLFQARDVAEHHYVAMPEPE